MPKNACKTEYLWTAAVALVILAYLAVFTVIDFRGFGRLATSDMYEDTLVARLMWEEKSLFPKRYLFGNQFYVCATPVLAALFYGLTGSMNRGMAWATLCMSALLLWAMAWMLRPVVKRPSLRAAALLCLLASVFGPFSVMREDGQQLFFAMCSFYACYLLCFFVVLGDYARAMRSEALRLPPLLCALLLCFCTGMQSLRQTCVLILPLLCFEGLHILRCLWKKQPVYPRARRMRLWRCAAYAGANALGLLVIRLLPVRRHEIYTGASVFSGASPAAKLRDLHAALVTVTGYDATREGDGRLFFILMFLGSTLLVLAALFLLLRGKRQADGAGCFWFVAVLGCLAVIAASFVTSVQLRPIYLFLYYALPALSLAVIAEKETRLRPMLLTLVCVLAALNLFFSYREDLSAALSREPTPAQQAADWAVRNGYELVYGNQSHAAPTVAAASDGALIAGCWQDDCIYRLSPYINIRDIYSLNDAERAVFIFMESELPLMRTEAAGNGTEMTPRAQYGPFWVYTASKQCLYPITEVIDHVPEYN